MDGRHNLRYLMFPAPAVIVSLYALLLLEDPLSSQDALQRGPELVRELYDSGPTENWLPTPGHELVPQVESPAQEGLPDHSRLVFSSFRD